MKLDLLSSASLLALGTALTLSVPGVANAGLNCSTPGICTETDQLSPTSQLADLTGADIAIDKFNAATDVPSAPGAVLTSVVVTLGGSYNSSGSIIAPAAGTGVHATYSNSMSLKIVGPGTFPSFTVVTPTALSSYTFADTVTQPFTANETFNSLFATTSSGLSAFSGTGTFNAFLTTQTIIGFMNSGGGTWTDTVNTYVDPSVTITYDYAAPEPATLGVLAVGLSGLGVVRRRRKR